MIDVRLKPPCLIVATNFHASLMVLHAIWMMGASASSHTTPFFGSFDVESAAFNCEGLMVECDEKSQFDSCFLPET